MNASSLRSHFAMQVMLCVKAAESEPVTCMSHATCLCCRVSGHDTRNATMVINLNRSFSCTLIFSCFVVNYVMHTKVEMLKGRRRRI